MGGAQPLAATMAGASMLAIECQPSASRCACAPLPRRAGRRPRRGAGADRQRRRARQAGLGRPARQRRRDPARAGAPRGVKPDAVTDQTSAHDPSTATCRGLDARQWEARARAAAIRRAREPRAARAIDGGARARDARFHAHGRADLRLRQQHPPGGAGRGREADAFDFPGFVPAYIRPLFCRGKGPFRWVALSGDPGGHLQDRRQGEGAVPRRRAPAPLARHGARAHRVPGPAGAHLLGRPGRAPPRSGSPSTRWWRAAS
jgi:urocanate hydratase